MQVYQHYDFGFTAEASEEFEPLSPAAIRGAIIRSLAAMSDEELMQDIRLNSVEPEFQVAA